MRRYPDEVAVYIREHIRGTTTRQMTEDLNARFGRKYGTVFTASQIKAYKSNHGLKSGTRRGNPPGHSIKYPDGIIEFLKEIAPGKTSAEMTDAVNAKYGAGTMTVRQMKAFKKNHHITSGYDARFKKGCVPWTKGRKMSPETYAKAYPTMFHKGNIPYDTKGVGSVSRTDDGYLVRKVREDGTRHERWAYVHREVWEREHGPIPDGMIVSFLDGNKENCSPDNLVLLDNNTNLEMNRSHLRTANAELTKTGVNLARLRIEVRKAKRKRGDA